MAMTSMRFGMPLPLFFRQKRSNRLRRSFIRFTLLISFPIIQGGARKIYPVNVNISMLEEVLTGLPPDKREKFADIERRCLTFAAVFV